MKSNQHQPSTVRKALIRIVVASIPIVIFLGIIEISLPEEPIMFFQKSEYIKQNRDDIEILYLGDSAMYSAIIPDSVHTASYNLGLPVEHPVMSLELAMHLSHELPKLHTVVLGLHHSSLFIVPEAKHHNAPVYWRHFDIKPEKPLDNYLISLHVRPHYLMNRLGQKLQPESLQELQTEPSELVETSKGHRYNIRQPKNLERTASRLFDNHLSKTTENTIGQNVEQMAELIQKLNERGVRVILIRLPVSEIYKRLELPDRNTAHDRAIASLTTQCSNCASFDYSNNEELIKNDLYSDGFHLNLDGAARLSSIFRNDLKLDDR